MNERTLQDLHEIRQIISEQQINIPDLQFLISREGRVVINDPQTPRKVAPGSDLGLTELNEFVKIVEEIIQLRLRR